MNRCILCGLLRPDHIYIDHPDNNTDELYLLCMHTHLCYLNNYINLTISAEVASTLAVKNIKEHQCFLPLRCRFMSLG